MRIFGHPVHPMLVHFPVAGFLLAPLSDAAGLASGGAFWPEAAFWLTAMGVAGASLAAIAGAFELPRLDKSALAAAGWHATLAVTALTAGGASLAGRMQDQSGYAFSALGHDIAWPMIASLAAAIATLAAAWFGGELVYRHGAGRLD